ncbi:MgtC/SapB family protein [Azospirillum sp.]|uniref:MgtC/SapB family protein n=1 Tax=Azospirillum sp. TaxID=34012 RepID=UPI002D5D29FC|nr:MgtC/SapB family protein [Azospirillum sp.]HYD70686.1 MgtC/SapB family protein [Azospirillum sp.]
MGLGTELGAGEIAVRMLLAVLCGAVLGFDREARGKAAGLRTQTLVALSAAATTLVALQMYADVAKTGHGGDVDPTRVIQGLAQAIGFISAGVMFQKGVNVRGVTTAAVIWMAGALGIACGAGLYWVAGLGLGLSLLVSIGFTWLERRLFPEGAREEE